MLLALCLLTAGCTGLVGSDIDREPYGVDEPFEPANEIRLDGVTDDRVTDWQALWNGHVERLEETSFVRTLEVTYESNETVLLNTTRRAVITVDGKEYAEHTRYVHDPETNETTTHTVEQWADDERVEYRTGDEDDEAAASMERTSSDPATRFPVEESTLFMAVESISVDRSSDRTRYVLSGSGTVLPYQNTTFYLVLTDRGAIEYLSLEGERFLNGDRVEVSIQLQTDRIGEPIDLEAPAWVDDRDAD
ncbi:hypothetical protein ACLI4Y_14225 [Natrialbaceae archaeon A-CW3]